MTSLLAHGYVVESAGNGGWVVAPRSGAVRAFAAFTNSADLLDWLQREHLIIETAPPSESLEGQEAQEDLPASEGGTEGSASPLRRSSGAPTTRPDSPQANPGNSHREGGLVTASPPKPPAEVKLAEVGAVPSNPTQPTSAFSSADIGDIPACLDRRGEIKRAS